MSFRLVCIGPCCLPELTMPVQVDSVHLSSLSCRTGDAPPPAIRFRPACCSDRAALAAAPGTHITSGDLPSAAGHTAALAILAAAETRRASQASRSRHLVAEVCYSHRRAQRRAIQNNGAGILLLCSPSRLSVTIARSALRRQQSGCHGDSSHATNLDSRLIWRAGPHSGWQQQSDNSRLHN